MKDEEIIRQIKNNDIFFVHNLSLDYKFQDGTMLIHKACLYNNLDLLLYLVGKGIDVNVKGGRYDSTLLYFTVYNHANELMYTLCELGADVGYTNSSKMSLFEVCIKFDNVLGFILLLHYIPNDFDIKNVHLYAHKKSNYRFLEIFKRLHAEERFTNQIVTYKSDKNHGERQSKLRFIAKSIRSTKIFLIVFTFLFYCLPNICICFVIYTIMSNNRAHMKDKLYVYMNIFYTVYFLLKFVEVDPSASFFIIPYFILLVKLLVTVPICKKNTLTESKDVIITLLRQERYTKDYFCYICWKYKDMETIHCHMCEKCIDNYDHHCKFLGHCINGDTKTYFLIYLYSTLILLLFIANLELSKSILIHYRLITMFTIFQIVGRLFV